MNPNSGFLRSSRARAKVATWFRKLDRDKNIAAGKELLEKELDRHNLTLSKVDKVVLGASMPTSWKICWPASAAATSASTSCSTTWTPATTSRRRKRKIAACWRSWSRRPTCRSGPSPRIT